MSDAQQDAGMPPSNQRTYGILLIALGVLFVILDLVAFALVGEAWVLIALIVAIPNFVRGFRVLREARDAGDGPAQRRG